MTTDLTTREDFAWAMALLDAELDLENETEVDDE